MCRLLRFWIILHIVSFFHLSSLLLMVRARIGEKHFSCVISKCWRAISLIAGRASLGGGRRHHPQTEEGEPSRGVPPVLCGRNYTPDNCVNYDSS